MNLKRFCTRFREMRTCYVGTKVSFLDKIFYAVDYVFAFIIWFCICLLYKIRICKYKPFIMLVIFHFVKNNALYVSN